MGRFYEGFAITCAIAVAPACAASWTCEVRIATEPSIECEQRDAAPLAVFDEAGGAWGRSPVGPGGRGPLADRVSIPLHSTPRDGARVEYLAMDVLCGGKRDCDVRFGNGDRAGKACLLPAAAVAGGGLAACPPTR